MPENAAPIELEPHEYVERHFEARANARELDRGEKLEPGLTVSFADVLALFRSLFAGRMDVYPVRWENAAGRSGYSPACRNAWVTGLCGKPAVRCSARPHAAFKEVTDEVILDHLTDVTAGVSPLLPMTLADFSPWISMRGSGARTRSPLLKRRMRRKPLKEMVGGWGRP
ncbi:MAG: TOTE conflict system archaeo-eukaryotic primase domain-containing protein [Steroidobacteraceae bacterium]